MYFTAGSKCIPSSRHFVVFVIVPSDAHALNESSVLHFRSHVSPYQPSEHQTFISMSILENVYMQLYFRGFNFNVILPKINTDYIRQVQDMNTDNLRLIKMFMSILMKTLNN